MNMISDYVVNAGRIYHGTANAEDVGIKAVDDKTLEFTLKSPCPYFVDLVSMWVYFPVQEATIEANGDKWTNQADTYICNGPFKITDMKMGESVVLEKNENYWDADNVTLQKLTYRYILDTSTALTAYENGEVDGVRTIPASDLRVWKRTCRCGNRSQLWNRILQHQLQRGSVRQPAGKKGTLPGHRP